VRFYTADICDQHSNHVQIANPVFDSYGGAVIFYDLIHIIKLFEDNGDLII